MKDSLTREIELEDLQRQRDALLLAVQLLVEEKADYMRINLLGDPETQHTIQVARKAIALCSNT